MVPNTNVDCVSIGDQGKLPSDIVELSKGKPDFDWDSYYDRSIVLQKLKTTNSFCDIILISSDGKEFPVHFAVMSALSGKLSDLIYQQINDPNNKSINDDPKPSTSKGETGNDIGESCSQCSSIKRVHLSDIPGSVLAVLVDCAYKGAFSIPYSRVWLILETAEKFEMNEIIVACCNYLVNHLTRENCISLLYLGVKHNHRLRSAAWSMIKREFAWLIPSSPNFASLKLDHLESLLDDDELDIESEELIWDAIKRWINEQPSSSSASSSPGSLVNRLIRYLRHGRVTQSFLTNKLAKDPLILTDISLSKLVSAMIKQNRHEFGKKPLDGHGLPVGLTPRHIRPRIPGSIIFAIGGWQEGVPTTLIETYDRVTNKWFECKIGQKVPRAYHGIEVISGIIYLIGGTNGSEILNTVNCFDPLTGKWFQRSNMYEQRCYVSTAVLGGFLYAMGGHNGLHRIRSVERYDPVHNQWTQIAEMNLARSDGCAAIHEGKIYIAGGLNDQVIENSVEVYDPAIQKWTLIQPMSSPRTSLSLVSYQGSLYALGGNNGFERLPTVERYDFDLKCWVAAPNMRSQRSTFSACVLGDNIYAVGGYNGQTPINKVEKFDSVTGEWVGIKNLKFDRSGLSICVLKGLTNGKNFTFLGQANKFWFQSKL